MLRFLKLDFQELRALSSFTSIIDLLMDLLDLILLAVLLFLQLLGLLLFPLLFLAQLLTLLKQIIHSFFNITQFLATLCHQFLQIIDLVFNVLGMGVLNGSSELFKLSHPSVVFIPEGAQIGPSKLFVLHVLQKFLNDHENGFKPVLQYQVFRFDVNESSISFGGILISLRCLFRTRKPIPLIILIKFLIFLSRSIFL